MDHMKDDTKRRAELADFLRIRRARLRPERFGLPTFGRRRTPGLRREEVAQLAGVGVSWYTWLEQGRAITVSDQVIERLAETFQLEKEERRHLFVLARGMVPVADESSEIVPPPPGLQAVLDALGTNPAYLIDHRFNLVAWNESACLPWSISKQAGTCHSSPKRRRHFAILDALSRTFHRRASSAGHHLALPQ